MNFYLANCLLLICVVQIAFSIPTFDNTDDEFIKFDERVKRGLDYDGSSSSEEDGIHKVKSTTVKSVNKPGSSSSSSSEEAPKIESSYEKQKKEIEELENKIKLAREKLAEKNQVKSKGKSSSTSDSFIIRPPGWTSPAPPTKQSLIEQHKKAMADLSQGLKDALRKYQEEKKEQKNDTVTFPGGSNINKRSVDVNLHELRDELEQRLVEIRTKRESRSLNRYTSTLDNKSDQSLLQLLNDIQTMTAHVREIRSQVQENRKE